MPEEVYTLLRSAMDDSFKADDMRKSAEKTIVGKLTEKDMKTVLVWLNSPVGEKITTMEVEAGSPEAFAEMQKMAPALLANKERVARIKTLDQAVKGTESGINMVLNTQMAMFTAFTAGLPAEQRPSKEQIKTLLEKNRPQLVKMIEQQTIISFLYTYRDLSDKELDAYIAFAQAPAGKKYNAVMLQAINDAIADGSTRLGDRLAKDLSKLKQ
jgi:hypothetical protein